MNITSQGLMQLLDAVESLDFKITISDISVGNIVIESKEPQIITDDTPITPPSQESPTPPEIPDQIPSPRPPSSPIFKDENWIDLPKDLKEFKVIRYTGNSKFELKKGDKVIIELGDKPVTEGIKVVGGDKVVIIGGEFDIPYKQNYKYASEARALYFDDVQTSVHVFGVVMGGRGLMEGIQIGCPNADVYIQNIWIDKITDLYDELGYKTNHPDGIQPHSGCKTLTINNVIGSSTYQFFLNKSDFAPLGDVKITNAQILPAYGTTDAMKDKLLMRYVLWSNHPSKEGSAKSIKTDNIWIQPLPKHDITHHVWHEGRPLHKYNEDFQKKVIAQYGLCEGINPNPFFARDQVGIGYQHP